jgi:hypothetical protein
MPIEKDLRTRTAIEITYARSGNTLHERTRHAVKDISGVIFITYDNLVSYVGAEAIGYLNKLKDTSASSQARLDSREASNRESEEEKQEDIDFINEQIVEIEALL